MIDDEFCIIETAKRHQGYLLYGPKHRDTQKRAMPGGLSGQEAQFQQFINAVGEKI